MRDIWIIVSQDYYLLVQWKKCQLENSPICKHTITLRKTPQMTGCSIYRTNYMACDKDSSLIKLYLNSPERFYNVPWLLHFHICPCIVQFQQESDKLFPTLNIHSPSICDQVPLLHRPLGQVWPPYLAFSQNPVRSVYPECPLPPAVFFLVIFLFFKLTLLGWLG